MQYIVLDLEWNQPVSYQSTAYRKVGDRLLFEVIQFGAAKMNEQFEIVDTISVPVRPTQYLTIHPRVKRMTEQRGALRCAGVCRGLCRVYGLVRGGFCLSHLGLR